jgi:hypothetical protein
MHGSTNEQLAKLLSVSVSSIEKWQREHKDFKRAIKEGRDEFDTNVVERTLLKRALGYDIVEIKTEEIEIKQGKGEHAIKVPAQRVTKTIKHILPDTGALCFWLKNRNPDRWRDIKAIELTGRDGKDLGVPSVLIIPDNGRGDAVRRFAEEEGLQLPGGNA